MLPASLKRLDANWAKCVAIFYVTHKVSCTRLAFALCSQHYIRWVICMFFGWDWFNILYFIITASLITERHEVILIMPTVLSWQQSLVTPSALPTCGVFSYPSGRVAGSRLCRIRITEIIGRIFSFGALWNCLDLKCLKVLVIHPFSPDELAHE